MRFLSSTNPAIHHTAFHAPHNDQSPHDRSKSFEKMVLIVRWAVAGLLLFMFLLPTVISVMHLA